MVMRGNIIQLGVFLYNPMQYIIKYHILFVTFKHCIIE